MKTYIDLYLLPVPKENLVPYRRQAKIFSAVCVECGALSYREFIGDDLDGDPVQSFAKAAKVEPSEVLTTAIAEFKSKRHRDTVMKKVLLDPRVVKMMNAKPLANMKKMYYGGFASIVSAKP